MYATYVLWSDKLGKRYVGSSKDPLVRLEEHNAAKSRFTSRGIPWHLKYCEFYATRHEALLREKYLKTGSGRIFLKRLFEGVDGYPESELPDMCLEHKMFI